MRKRHPGVGFFNVWRICLIVVAGGVPFVSGCASGRITADPVYFPASGGPAHVVHLKSFNRIDDLVAIEPTFVELIRGERYTSRIESAAGVTARGENLYVCDTDQGVIHVWNLTTGNTRRLGQTGELRLATPVDVAVGADGSVYVADTGLGAVVALRANGAVPVRLRRETDASFRPVSLAISDDKLYVADLESASIVVFDTSTGGVTTTLTLSDKTGDAVMPMGVAIGPKGNLFVSDAMGGRVVVLSADDGKLIRTMSRRGNRLGDMGQPKHLDVSADGTVFVADSEFAHVHLYNGDGQLLMLIGGPDDRAGGTPMPLGVAVAEKSATLERLVPAGFEAQYFVVVTNSLGSKRINLFAVGMKR